MSVCLPNTMHGGAGEHRLEYHGFGLGMNIYVCLDCGEVVQQFQDGER